MPNLLQRIHVSISLTFLIEVAVLSVPLNAVAVNQVDDWNAYDLRLEEAVATRPDAFYPPFERTFTHTMGLWTFDPAGFPGLTNTPPLKLVGDVPLWSLQTVETNGWFVTSSGGTIIHSKSVAPYDALHWTREKYGNPPPWFAGDPTRLAEWYFLRRRERIEMSVSLVPQARWAEYVAALVAAAAGLPAPGVPGPVLPADTNRVAFARIGMSAAGSLGFDLYTPGDLPVDIFSKTNLLDGLRWHYAGTVQASAPFTPSALAPPHTTLVLHAARGDIDSDGDGIPDGMEILHFGTNPHLWDSSGDGLSDWIKIYRYGLDPLQRDSDGDGYPDAEELLAGSDPTTPNPGAHGSVRYYHDEDDRLTGSYVGADGEATTTRLTPAGNPLKLQERGQP